MQIQKRAMSKAHDNMPHLLWQFLLLFLSEMSRRITEHFVTIPKNVVLSRKLVHRNLTFHRTCTNSRFLGTRQKCACCTTSFLFGLMVKKLLRLFIFELQKANGLFNYLNTFMREHPTDQQFQQKTKHVRVQIRVNFQGRPNEVLTRLVLFTEKLSVVINS